MYKNHISLYPNNNDVRIIDASDDFEENKNDKAEDFAFSKLIDENRTKHPLLSVVIIAENIISPEHFDCFTRCLNSINTQWFSDAEIIAVNYRSKDGTQRLLEQYHKIGLVDKYYAGMGNNLFEILNIAAEKYACGEYITFIHFEDYYHNPSAFFDIISKMSKDNLDFAAFESKTVSKNTTSFINDKEKNNISDLLYRYEDNCQGNFYKRSVFLNEKFDLRYLWANDYELTIRLLLKGYRNFSFKRAYKTTNLDRIKCAAKEIVSKELPGIYLNTYGSSCGLKPSEARRMAEYKFMPPCVLFFLKKRFKREDFYRHCLETARGLFFSLKDDLLLKKKSKKIRCPICGAKNHIKHNKTLYDDKYGFMLQANYNHCTHCGLEYCTEKRSSNDQLALSKIISNSHRKLFDHPDLPPMRCWINNRKQDRNKFFSKAFRWIPLNTKILDIGCGDCQNLIYHKIRSCEVHGLDITPKTRDIAIKNGIKNIVISPIEKVKYKHKSFDYITLEQFIEHSANPEELLNQLYQYLKIHGRLIITTPNANSAYRYLLGPKWLGWNAPYHYRIFSKKSLMLLAQKTGFKIVYLETLTEPNTLFEQIFHIKNYPVYGKPSEFHLNKSEKIIDDLIQDNVLLRVLKNIGFHQWISQITDKFDIGDTLAVVLERPECINLKSHERNITPQDTKTFENESSNHTQNSISNVLSKL